MQNPKFQVFKASNAQVYFRLRAKNGEPILLSEGYSSKSSCLKGIESIKENSSDDGKYVRNNLYRWEILFYSKSGEWRNDWQK